MVKASRETYERLNELAGKLKARLHRSVSMDEVLDSAIKVSFAGITRILADSVARTVLTSSAERPDLSITIL